MQTEIHPECKDVSVSCRCGNKFVVQMVLKEKALKLDICSKCHPFYTKEQKLVDTEGQVDKFNKRFSFSMLDAKPPVKAEKKAK
ncbi:MAG: 50S ribosomal protein L31 [Thiotrichales bacterium]|nr:MAG: 50S ribosomal protein L31 [Thiotrichales bacterium]